MKKRTPADSRMAWRGAALIVALGMAAAGERMPTSASQAASPFFSPYYKILNLGTFHQDPLCSAPDCSSEAFDVNIWGQVVGSSDYGDSLSTLHAFRTGPNQAIVSTDVLLPLFWQTVSEARGLNDAGVAAGYSWSPYHAVLWPVDPPWQVSSLDPAQTPTRGRMR